MKNYALKTAFGMLLLAAAIATPAKAGDATVFYYSPIPGPAVAALTNSPNFPASPLFSQNLSAIAGVTPFTFSTVRGEGTVGGGNNYGTWTPCFLDVPATGNYQFYIVSSAGSVLRLSTNASPTNAQVIAQNPDSTGASSWVNDGLRSSLPISLVKGQQYYLDVLQKGAGSPDFYQVGWLRADGVLEQPMSAAYIQPYTGTGTNAQLITDVASLNVTELGQATFQVTVASPAGTTFQWFSNTVSIPGAISSYYIIAHATLPANGSTYHVVINPPGQSSITSGSGTLNVSADSSQPTVVQASPLGNFNAVTVKYSKIMSVSSVTNTNHYTLTDQFGSPISITNATLASDLQTVTLQLASPLVLGETNYTLTISGVTDGDASADVISPNPTVISFGFGVGPTYTFDDGLLPQGTTLWSTPDTAGNTINPYAQVTNQGGFNNTGMLILTEPAVGQTFEQWLLPDLANGAAITNLTVSFNAFIGNGSGGDATVNYPPAGGNGLTFHWGPGLLNQYAGGASSFGVGLDINLRTYNSAPNTPGINIFYGGTAGAGANTPIATSGFLDYYRGDVATFNSNTLITFHIAITNTTATLTMSCSNAWDGLTNIYTNLVIPNFTMPLASQPMAFTTTDGSGAHEAVFLDNVDFTVNGTHLAGGGGNGPVVITQNPASVTTNENVPVQFSVGVSGAGPFNYQWYSNGVVIPFANATTYTIPLTLYSTMNGSSYYVVVSNNFSSVTSTPAATLTLTHDTVGTRVQSVGSVDGNSVDVLYIAYVDTVTAGNPANYTVNGNHPTTATVRVFPDWFGNPTNDYAPSYLKTVRLTLASPVSSGYSVVVSAAVQSRTGVSLGTSTNLVGNVMEMTDTDFGVPPYYDPVVPGESFSGSSNSIEVVGSGDSLVPIGSAAGDTAHFTYNVSPRTGNFDMMVRATFQTDTAAGAKAGIMARPSVTDSISPAVALKVFPPAPGNNTYETAIRPIEGATGLSWSATSGANNGHSAATWPNNFMRLRRLGSAFVGEISPDGSSWTVIGLTNADITAFPLQEYVGLFSCAGNDDGRMDEADYTNWGIMSFPGALVTINSNLPVTTSSFQGSVATFSVIASATVAPASELVYEWQRQDPGGSSFYDLESANELTNDYTTPFLSTAADSNALYRVIVYVGDPTAGSAVTSAVTRLTVGSSVAPTITSASTVESMNEIVLTWNEPLDPNSAQNAARYTLNLASGGFAPVSITGATLTNGTSVVLTLSGALSQGVLYTIGATNVQDSFDQFNSATTHKFTGWIMATGYLSYQRYLGLAGPFGNGTEGLSYLFNDVNFPNNPDFSGLITWSGNPDCGSGGSSLLQFGSLITGFFIPPSNGVYQFYMRANDSGILVLSSDNTAANCTNEVCGDDSQGQTTQNNGSFWLYSITNGVNTATFPSLAPWGPFIPSNAVTLVGGQPYYLEALQAQGTGSSFIEFSWGVPGNSNLFANISGNTNLLFTAVPSYNAFPAGSGGGNGVGNPTAGGPGSGAGVGGLLEPYSIAGTNIGTLINPDASAITAIGLATNTSAYAGSPTNFSITASATISAGGAPVTVTPTFQWMRSGTNITGATGATYTTPILTPADSNSVWSVVITIPGLTITNSTTLSVITLPLAVTSAGSFGGNTIGIVFNQTLNAASATNPANYSVSGGSIASIQLRPDGKTVLITLSGSLSGSTFTVTLNNVAGLFANAIPANTKVTGNLLYQQLTDIDIGVATATAPPGVVQTNTTLTNLTVNLGYPGSAVAGQDGVFQILASGQGMGVNGLGSNSVQDGIHYLYETRTGDFDVAVHVELIGGSDSRAKAGLVFRESLQPGSREYAIVVDPPGTNAADGSGLGYNGVETIERNTTNAAMASFPTTSLNGINSGPNPPVLWSGSTISTSYGNGLTNMYPIWLRIRRAGSNVYLYTGADGTNWYLCARDNAVPTNWANSFYLGMITTSENQTNYTQSQFSHYGNYVAPLRKQVLMLSGGDVGGTGNQIGLTSGGSFGISSALNTPAGNPNAPALRVTPSTFLYNLFLGLGYNVTVVHAATSASEDGMGKSLIIWGGDCQSADTSSNGKWVALQVPEISWKYSSYEKNYWISTSSDRSNPSGITSLMIVNTNNPITGTNGVFTLGQTVQVVSNSQYFSYAISNDLADGGAGFTVVGVDPSSPTHAYLFYADAGTPLYTNSTGASPVANTFTNKTASRRVGLWMGDNSSSPVGDWSQTTPNGMVLLTNAINWATAIATNAPTVTAPTSQFVAVGQMATFFVTASGQGPFTYQWMSNNVAISGATYPDYTTTAAVLANNGDQYKVLVTGLYGSVTTSAATLTVQGAGQPPPSFGPLILANGQLTLTWTNGSTLQWATNLLGPWMVVTNATTPYVVSNLTLPAEFFRVQQ